MLVTMLMIKIFFGFKGSYFKIAPTNIDDYTKNKFLNIQQYNLIPQINKQNNDKKTDEGYRKSFIGEKESDERYHISKNDEDLFFEDTEITKLQNLSSQKHIKI